MNSLLVTGCNGQLGREMQELAARFSEFGATFTDVGELDITDEPAVVNLVGQIRPRFIVNCAAYTAVDRAESDERTAWQLNVQAVRNLVNAAERVGAALIHISTDYVFDGTSPVPYKESDQDRPVSVYGKTKAEGERVVLDYEWGTVIRTSWLYSPHGNNFAKTIRRLGLERSELQVVFDQVGTPTYALDLAEAIFLLLRRMAEGYHTSGLLHFSNEGVCSWYDFAREILLSSNLSCRIVPVESVMFPTPVKRPAYSVLNKSKIKALLQIDIRHWQDAWRHCLTRLS